MIKKKELYAAVAASTGLRKKDVRAVTDAMLAEIRQQLADGVDVQCPPLGKIKVINQKPGTEQEKRVYKIALADMKPVPVEASEPVVDDAQ